MRGANFEDALPLVAEIVADVRERGDEALLDWTERFDGERPELRVPADQLRSARLEPDELEALRALADAVAAFCEPQRPPDVALEAVEGVHSERRWVPLASVGVYVPGGRATYPSSLVMAAVPARVAGVERIAIVTPKASEATLAAAHALGIDEVYAVGGAQAVAALAFGTETIAPVDKIVGPGNRWVTAAKLLVSSHVAIDLPAGPSEVVLIADASADPARCAADLLAQAEHGPDSEAILLSLDRGLSAAVASPRRRHRQRFGPRCGDGGRGARALGGLRAGASRALGGRSGAAARAGPQRGHGLRPHVRRRRRLRRRRDAHPPDRGPAREAPAGSGSRRSSSPCRSSGPPSSRTRARSGCRWPVSKGSRCTRPPWSWRESAAAP